MARNHVFRNAALALPFAGTLLMSFSIAQSAQQGMVSIGRSERSIAKEPPQGGAQIVAQGTASGAIACARCHGFDGEADGSGAFPKLAGQFPQYLAKQLRAYASGARQNALMEPIAKVLKDAEIDSVAQYYASLRPSMLPSRPVASELVTRGEQLAKFGDLKIRVQACESCHGPNGQGEPPAVPYLAGQYAHYINVQIQMFRQNIRKSQQMQDPAHSLREPDIAAVAAYFERASRAGAK
jgi:cytochrome c553